MLRRLGKSRSSKPVEAHYVCICCYPCMELKCTYDDERSCWTCTIATFANTCGPLDIAKPVPGSSSAKAVESTHGRTNYTAEDISRVLLPILMFDNKATVKTLKLRALEYMFAEPKAQFLSRAKRMALETLNSWGDVDDISMVYAQARAYKDHGWSVKVVLKPQAAARRIVLEACKKAHAEAEKKKKNADPTYKLELFDEKTVPYMARGGEFIEGVSVVNPAAEVLMSKLQDQVAADFTHHKGNGTDVFGIHGVVVGLDAERKLVPLVYLVWLGNETAESWKALYKAAKTIPGFDVSTRRIITDGDKGATSAHNEVFVEAKRFRCYTHRKANIANKDARSLLQKLACTAAEQKANVFGVSFVSGGGGS